jgi:3-oxoacyl-[acyl-carrier-protein] synthase-1
MEQGDVGVVGVGMVSSVGLSAPEVAASVRAGTMRLEESALVDRHFRPFTLAVVPEDGLPALHPDVEAQGLTSREARMLRLAQPALRECLAALPPGAPPPPLMLSLPETPTTRELDGERLLDALSTQVGGFDRRLGETSFRGRAGGITAVARAVQWLGAGAPFAVVGGVDTYRDLYVLGTLDMERRVKSAANLDGFVPGEGAAFLLLVRGPLQGALAALSGFGAGLETGHLYSEKKPYRGDGLAGAFAASLANGCEPIRDVYSSMNGESHWAKEWGVAFMRSRAGFAEDHGMHHPADCHGDTGAAAGPMMVGLAALGIRDGYRRSPCLVYASSDRGARAAVVVTSA